MAGTEDRADSPLSGVSAQAGINAVADGLARHKIVRVHNTAGAFQALLCARLSELPGFARPLIAVTADETLARELVRDLRFFLASSGPGPENVPTGAPRVRHLPGSRPCRGTTSPRIGAPSCSACRR